MRDPDDLDAQLAAHFASEHTHVPPEPFVAVTLRRILHMQRRSSRLRIGLRGAALLLLISTSPWLIAGVEQLNAVLESSISWTAGQPFAWMLAAVLVAILGVRILRSR